MTELKKTTVGEIAEIHTGRSLSSSEDEFWGGNIPRATARDLKSSFITKTSENITEKGREEIGGGYLPEGTIVISTRGNIGKISMAKVPLFISQNLKGLIVDAKRVKPKYLLYYLETKKDRLKELSSGSSVKSLTKKELSKVKVELPDIETQEEIVEKINFVEESRRESQKHLEKINQLRKEVMKKLFQEGFDSKATRQEPVYGEIPEKWRLKPLKELTEIKMGQSPNSEKLSEKEKGKPFVQDGSDLGLRTPGPSRWIKDHKTRSEKNRLLTLVRGSEVGKTNIADRDYAIGRGIAKVEPREIDTEFLHYYLNFRRDRVKDLSGSGTTSWISKKDLQKLKVPIPPKSEQQNFVEVLHTLDNIMVTDNELIKKSDQTKDSLISEFLDSSNNYSDGETV